MNDINYFKNYYNNNRDKFKNYRQWFYETHPNYAKEWWEKHGFYDWVKCDKCDKHYNWIYIKSHKCCYVDLKREDKTKYKYETISNNGILQQIVKKIDN